MKKIKYGYENKKFKKANVNEILKKMECTRISDYEEQKKVYESLKNRVFSMLNECSDIFDSFDYSDIAEQARLSALYCDYYAKKALEEIASESYRLRVLSITS